MLLYRLQPGSRPLDGYYSIRIDDTIKFLLILRSEIMKDQYRLIYSESQNRRPDGIFVQGSNKSLQGESLYTKTITGRKAKFLYGREEILPSEYAAKELWFYQSSDEKNA